MTSLVPIPIGENEESQFVVKFRQSEFVDFSNSILVSVIDNSIQPIEAIRMLIEGQPNVSDAELNQTGTLLEGVLNNTMGEMMYYPKVFFKETSRDDPEAIEIIPNSLWVKIMYQF